MRKRVGDGGVIMMQTDENIDTDSIYEPEVSGDLYMIELPKTGCHLAIYRRELMTALGDDLAARCLQRGKAIKRHRTFQQRERKLSEK